MRSLPFICIVIRQNEQAIAKQRKRTSFFKITVDERQVPQHNTPHLLQSR
jgi:hypothetical protein